jgi:protein-S-isoprenylcysteine O-methyltransferase Ste14
MDRSVIPREERMVEDVFAEEYRSYKAKTKRWM